MEVQKHPHHVTHKKKWTEYLLEFFMLFLAVFLGFFAENIRENIVERHREKKYIESLIEDVRADTSNAQSVVDEFTTRQPKIDTCVNYFGELMNGDSKVFLRNLAAMGNFKDFDVTDGTMQQLKNAGGFNLIGNKAVVDSIMYYDAAAKDIIREQEHLSKDHFLNVWHYEDVCLDRFKIDSLVHIYKMDIVNHLDHILLTNNRQELVLFYSSLRELRGNFRSWRQQLAGYKNQGTRLIVFLQKEYHLGKE